MLKTLRLGGQSLQKYGPLDIAVLTLRGHFQTHPAHCCLSHPAECGLGVLHHGLHYPTESIRGFRIPMTGSEEMNASDPELLLNLSVALHIFPQLPVSC